jgi:Restriction endonuclease
MHCWRSTRVGVRVRGANCPGTVVITNSTFTPGAEGLARVRGVELVDGKLLRLRLQETLGESWGNQTSGAARLRRGKLMWNVDVSVKDE